MPTPEPIQYSYPLETDVHYLINTARQFTDPAQKIRKQLQLEGYFDHSSYQPKHAPISQMLSDNAEGYQIVPGKFERDAEGKIKRESCWQSQQVFIVEFDDAVQETSLDAVVRNNRFIRDNALALIESIRSGYNDPNDPNCNGELRYRAFFLMPRNITDIKIAKFIVKKLLACCPDADGSGSNLTNGALGLQGINKILLGNFIEAEVRDQWRLNWETEQSKFSRWTVSEQINIKEIPSEHAAAVGRLSFDSKGWSDEMLPCIFANHETRRLEFPS